MPADTEVTASAFETVATLGFAVDQTRALVTFAKFVVTQTPQTPPVPLIEGNVGVGLTIKNETNFKNIKNTYFIKHFFLTSKLLLSTIIVLASILI